MAYRKEKIWGLLILAVLSVIAVFSFPPVPQPQEYYDFSDQRKILGIPNFMDVLSNLPFFFIGLWGLSINSFNKKKKDGIVPFTLFMGFVLLAFGSGYFHWSPNDFTLVFDRMAMAIIFMSFFTLVLYDYISRSKALFFFPWLVLLGIGSVIWWYLTEVGEKGDLRPYILVQYFPVLAIPLVMVLFRGQYDYRREMLLVYFFFILAKATEETDEIIFRFTGFISGHTLKHLFMAIAGVFIVKLAQKRKAGSGN